MAIPQKYKNSGEYISWEVIEQENDLPLFMQLKEEGIVDVHYEVKDTRTTKKVRHLKRLLSSNEIDQEIEKLGKRAPKQKELLNWSKQLTEELIKYEEVTKQAGFSSAVIREAEKKGWFQSVYLKEYRDPYAEVEFDSTLPHLLNDEQQHAFNQIQNTIKENKHDVFLLKGVTGSGKTEVYLQSIAKVLEKGQGALMLVPEISLTPQMVARFKGRFGDQVAVLHSGLSDGEKYDEWQKIEKEEARV